MKTSNEILQERAAIIEKARAILTKAEDEERDATAEERQQFAEMMDDADKMKDEADQRHRLEVMEEGLEERQETQAGLQAAGAQVPEKRFVELRQGYNKELRKIELPQGDEEHARMFRSYLKTGTAAEELRALSKGTDSEGGYLSPPLEFMAMLIKDRDNMVFVRQMANVLPPLLQASTLGIPAIDNDMSDPAWTSEASIGSEDTTFDFARRELTPHALAKFIKVSKKLLRNSTMNVDDVVRQRLAYKFATAEEKAYLTGSGSGEPLGVFTASASGVSTDRDVESAATTTFDFDDLIGVVEKCKEQYQRNAAWIMHRNVVSYTRKLKDENGQYLWQPSKQAGQPDMLLGYPVHKSEYAPDSFTADQYLAVFGDFREYWIVDALTVTVQVLVELYAGANQNGYLGRLEADGAPVQENAFARLKTASA